MHLQLNPQIPVIVLPHGPCPGGGGQAVVLIDYSEEHDLHWVVILDAITEGEPGGQIWTVSNRHVRGFPNITMGRTRA